MLSLKIQSDHRQISLEVHYTLLNTLSFLCFYYLTEVNFHLEVIAVKKLYRF
jgi:hypothetical protein